MSNTKYLISASAANGFWRCGKFFPKAGIVVSRADFEDAQWKRLNQEPLLRVKKVADIMEGARDGASRFNRRQTAIAENRATYANISPAQLGKTIAGMEKQMFHHAEMLEFEEAARVRDEIGKLRDAVLLDTGR